MKWNTTGDLTWQDDSLKSHKKSPRFSLHPSQICTTWWLSQHRLQGHHGLHPPCCAFLGCLQPPLFSSQAGLFVFSPPSARHLPQWICFYCCFCCNWVPPATLTFFSFHRSKVDLPEWSSLATISKTSPYSSPSSVAHLSALGVAGVVSFLVCCLPPMLECEHHEAGTLLCFLPYNDIQNKCLAFQMCSTFVRKSV